MGEVVPFAGLTVAVSVIGEFCVIVAAEVVKVVAVLTMFEFTVTSIVPDADALKVPVPAYAAVSELVPACNAEVVKVADPDEREAVPSEVPPL